MTYPLLFSWINPTKKSTKCSHSAMKFHARESNCVAASIFTFLLRREHWPPLAVHSSPLHQQYRLVYWHKPVQLINLKSSQNCLHCDVSHKRFSVFFFLVCFGLFNRSFTTTSHGVIQVNRRCLNTFSLPPSLFSAPLFVSKYVICCSFSPRTAIKMLIS